MSRSHTTLVSLAVLLTLVPGLSASALESHAQWIEIPDSVAEATAQRLEVAKSQALELRSRALGATESLLAEGPEATEAELHRALHFVRAGLPGAQSGVASERILGATLANHVQEQGARHRSVDLFQLSFVNLGEMVVVAEPGTDIVATRAGGVTVRRSGPEEVFSFGAPSVLESIGLQIGFQGPNVANASFGGGSCGNSFRSGGRGRVGLCWWKYRMYDQSTSNDYWAYLGAVTAEPANLSLQPDPYIRFARSASQMGSSHRTTLGYVGFTDHDPRVDQTGGNCTNVTVGISRPFSGTTASASISAVLFCDKWDQYTNGGTSYKRNQFDTGVFGDRGRDVEAAHGSLSHTGQRPWSSYFPSWTDTWWASFCRVSFADCQSY